MTAEYVEFKKYDMTKSILMDKSIVHHFDHFFSELIMLARLRDYEVSCYSEYKIINTFALFSFKKYNRFIFNICLNVVKKNIFDSVELICIQDYKNPNKNFDTFVESLTSAGIYDENKTAGNGVRLKTIEEIKTAFTIMKNLILNF